jgi:hypothetical protein
MTMPEKIELDLPEGVKIKECDGGEHFSMILLDNGIYLSSVLLLIICADISIQAICTDLAKTKTSNLECPWRSASGKGQTVTRCRQSAFRRSRQ